ncbi:MAG: hypothetical protein ACHQUA_00060 [Microgenomates group bacterium]
MGLPADLPQKENCPVIEIVQRPSEKWAELVNCEFPEFPKRYDSLISTITTSGTPASGTSTTTTT